MKAAIIGAGSIGNHLAFSARKANWNVTIFDQDPEALNRFKSEIYPARYGSFDSNIVLMDSKKLTTFPSETFEVIMIGTPPDTHLKVLQQVIGLNPRVIFIEKPLCPPIQNEILKIKTLIEGNSKILFLSGYNHRLSLVTENLINSLTNSEECISSLEVAWLENWEGIMRAHPWIKGPSETYLGWTRRGGGALYEHSHGLDLWIYLSYTFGFGLPKKIRARTKRIENDKLNYDEEVEIQVTTETGFVGEIKQDVMTSPSKKWIQVKTKKNLFTLQYGNSGKDSLVSLPHNNEIGGFSMEISKPRPSDFDPEISIIQKYLTSKSASEANRKLGALSGLFTAYVASKAIESSELKKEVEIDLKGWGSIVDAAL